MKQTMYMATRDTLRVSVTKKYLTLENQHFGQGCIIQYR